MVPASSQVRDSTSGLMSAFLNESRKARPGTMTASIWLPVPKLMM